MIPKIIAEVASCHNGDIELGKKIIQAAAETGIDIVKFQSWQSKNVADNDPEKKRYASLELTNEAHYIYMEECEKNGVEFLTTCWDEGRIEFLKSLGLKKIKIASIDLKHAKFLKKIRENFEEVIVSAGMSTKEEILKAIEVLKSGNYTILHCTAIYPCPLEKANLKKLLWLKQVADSVGYSDHTHGVTAAVIAMGMGVKYIEKHLTLDRNAEQIVHTMGEGMPEVTTHSVADEPEVFKELADWRYKYEIALGNGSLEIFTEEKIVRERYTGRLGQNT